ncbi:Uncharacterised protein [uncultured archaeon]|nr:Uncharacterised protein [uncultured archaeon]
MIKKEGIDKPKVMTKAELEQSLIDNFINLQKVLTNLAIKFDDLSTNMSKLLQLFEISAKSFAEKYSGEIPVTGSQADVDNEFLKKLDSLLEQNKVISKGIMLMEEKVRERASPPQQFSQPPQNSGSMGMPRKPLPRY